MWRAALIFFVGNVGAAPIDSINPINPVSAGRLENQLRQMQTDPATPSSSDVLLLPDVMNDSNSMVQDTSINVTLQQVIFSGDFIGNSDKYLPIEEQLQEVVAPWLKKPLSFSDLQKLRDDITQFYRQRGFLLARAVLPPQSIEDGKLNVEIILGVYGKPIINSSSSLKTSVLQRLFSANTPLGKVVHKRDLERSLLLLNEIPGITGQMSLQQGSQPGTSSLSITVNPSKSFGGYMGLNNRGHSTTGRYQALGGIYIKNLMGLGDLLRLDMQASNKIGGLLNGSLDYRVLVGGYGTSIGVGYGHLNYHYEFNNGNYDGDSNKWLVYVTHPMVRTSRAKIDVTLSGGQQYLVDKFPEVLLANLGTEGHKKVTLGSLEVAGGFNSITKGMTSFALSGTWGGMDYRNEVASLIGFERELGSGGQFSRINYELSHEQKILGVLSLYGKLVGQESNRNLDGSQKLFLSGPAAVRAYGIGQAGVDRGSVASIELRTRRNISEINWLDSVPQLDMAIFYDYGWGTRFRNNRLQDGIGVLTHHNRINLAGLGVYVNIADSGNYSLTLTLAKKVKSNDPLLGGNNGRQFWINAIKMF